MQVYIFDDVSVIRTFQLSEHPLVPTRSDKQLSTLQSNSLAIICCFFCCFNLSAELELNWDPLGESCREMMVAERSLISKQPFELPAFIDIQHSTKLMECFERDSLVKIVNEEEAELPLSFNSVFENSEHSNISSNIQLGQSDVPFLNLGSRYDRVQPSSGYQCKAKVSMPNLCQKSQSVDSHKSTLMATSSSHQVSALDSSKVFNDQHLESTDPNTAAWEIIQLSNSRVSDNNSSSRLYSSLYNFRCDGDKRVISESLRTMPRRCNINSAHSSPELALNIAEVEGELGSFMMLRFPGSTPERQVKEAVSGDESGNDVPERNGGEQNIRILTCHLT